MHSEEHREVTVCLVKLCWFSVSALSEESVCVESAEVGKGVVGSFLWLQNNGYSFGRSAVQGQGRRLSTSIMCEYVCVCVDLFGAH